jgi:serine/threonine protein kinase
MSPEQTMGEKDLDARSDLWSLAAITFECLTGKRAFEADAIGRVMSKICYEPVPVPSAFADVPEGFDAWFARATEREAKDRFPTASAFATSLAEVLSPGQRWLDTRSDEGHTSTPSGPQPASASVLAEAPTELPAPPAGITGQTASRTVTPDDRIPLRAARGARQTWIVAAVVTFAVAIGVGVLTTRGDADAGSAAEPRSAEASGPRSPASGPLPAAVSASMPVVAPTSPTVAPASGAAAVSADPSVAPLAAEPSATRPPVPSSTPRRPAPSPRPSPATSVNLGI